MDDSSFVKEYHGQTVLHPLGLVAIIVLGGMMLILPRRHAVLPMLIMACFIAPAQRIALFTLNFDLLRIMVLFGTARVLIHGEAGKFRWHKLDVVLVAWTIVSTIAFVLQRGALEALKTKLGESYDAVGMYFLFRILIRDWDDVWRLARGISIISIPVALAFVVERLTGRNLFAALGGVPEFTVIREGRLRCQGAFAHPILAGCFWACLLPLIVSLWYTGRQQRIWGTVGILNSSLIIALCASSTPVMAVGACIIGACALRFRHSLSVVRWSIVAVLFALHLVMQKPVWHLVSRIDVAGGSTGWHRYFLIDNAIRHFGEWWLVGIRSTVHWGWGMQDITNQYIFEGVRGGFLTLVLFVAMIVIAFQNIGRIWRAAEGDRYALARGWALGVTLFAHCMNFVAVSYFGQIIMIWYLTLAMTATLAMLAQQRRPVVADAGHTLRSRLSGALAATRRRIRQRAGTIQLQARRWMPLAARGGAHGRRGIGVARGR